MSHALQRKSLWGCGCGKGAHTGLCRMPPAPEVMTSLFMEYRRNAKRGMTFEKYLQSIGFIDPSVTTRGMDDRLLAAPAGEGIQFLSVPRQPITGKLRVIVLLVAFSDRPAQVQPDHYEDLLFSKGKHPTGSMRDYYAEASHGKVEVEGTVHGWFKMPETYDYYVNNESGTGVNSYPRNCKRLAEDAVKAAIAAGVSFPPALDKLGQQFITALFIVHAGRGAEYQPTVEGQKREIWSHKWNVSNPVEVGPDLAATTYLVVPHDCRIGVCAHELGHLAFQWQDFYDPNYNKDGKYWDGSGSWDLMAGGAHNHNGTSPAHPAALHKLQHGWVSVQTVKKTTTITLRPSTPTTARVVQVTSPAFGPGQFLLLENRQRTGFDAHLPGDGLLVWKVDTAKEMYAPATPGMQLIQADGLQNLANADDYNEGDDGDPFPGSSAITKLKDTGSTSTSFPGVRSGIELSNIQVNAKGVITLKVTIKSVAQQAAGAASAVKRAIRAVPKDLPPAIGQVTDPRLTLPGLLEPAKPKPRKYATRRDELPRRAGRSAAG